MTAGPEVTEWRAWGESWLAAVIPGFLTLGGIVFVLQAVGYRGGRSPFGVVLILFGLGLAAVGVLLLVVLYRTRVRLTADGIEIRQTRPEVLPWSDVERVQLDRGRDSRTITVSLRGGRTRTLPTPTQGKRPATDTTLVDAVAAIRRRLR